jgi:hypothetical protein
MINNIIFEFFFLLLFKFGIDKIMENLEESGRFTKFLLYLFLNFIPLIVLSFIKVHNSCKGASLMFKINKAITESMIKLGSTELFKKVIGLIPFLNKGLILLEFIPYMDKIMYINYYLLMAGVVNLFNKLNNSYCDKISLMETISAVILGGLYMLTELFWEVLFGWL